MLRYDCPPNNEETTERILEATVVETAQYVLVDVWNGMHFYFDIDHITPVHGAFCFQHEKIYRFLGCDDNPPPF